MSEPHAIISGRPTVETVGIHDTVPRCRLCGDIVEDGPSCKSGCPITEADVDGCARTVGGVAMTEFDLVVGQTYSLEKLKEMFPESEGNVFVNWPEEEEDDGGVHGHV